ncbi:MAG TPA: hypothetical protein VLT33_25115 [Labilithrix sp.]|nr:hypothetical protein [Labilithrix sp.]
MQQENRVGRVATATQGGGMMATQGGGMFVTASSKATQGGGMF